MTNVRRINAPKLKGTPAQNREAEDFMAGYPERRASTDDTSRRAILLAAIGSLVDDEPGWANTDDMRSNLLSSRTGDVAHAYLCAHTDIEGELMKVAATALAWLEEIERQRAR